MKSQLSFSPSQQRIITKWFLVLTDITLLSASYMTAVFLRFGNIKTELLFTNHFMIVIFSCVSALYLFDLYTKIPIKAKMSLLARILPAIVAAFALISFLLYVIGVEFFVGESVGRGVLGGTLAVFTVSVWISRNIWATFVLRSAQKQKYVFIGNQTEIDQMVEAVSHDSMINPTTFVHTNLDEFLRIIGQAWSMMIVGESVAQDQNIRSVLIHERLKGSRILLPSEFYERHLQKIPVQLINDEWTLRYGAFSLTSETIGLRVKRFSDISISLVLLILSLPIFLLLPIILFIFDRGPIFYRQTRVGLNGSLFEIIKFRTMIVNAESQGAQWAQQGDARITSIGRFLRTTRIDELPQLFCVLKGTMSLIGPRPERPEFTKELSKVIPFYDLRHLVKPGVSGWAQVMYPYGASVEDAIRKLEYDLFYLKNYSAMLDLVIILKTIKTVLGKLGR